MGWSGGSSCHGGTVRALYNPQPCHTLTLPHALTLPYPPTMAHPSPRHTPQVLGLSAVPLLFVTHCSEDCTADSLLHGMQAPQYVPCMCRRHSIPQHVPCMRHAAPRAVITHHAHTTHTPRTHHAHTTRTPRTHHAHTKPTPHPPRCRCCLLPACTHGALRRHAPLLTLLTLPTLLTLLSPLTPLTLPTPLTPLTLLT